MDEMLFRGQKVIERFFAAEFQEGRGRSQTARGSPVSGSARADFDLKTFFLSTLLSAPCLLVSIFVSVFIKLLHHANPHIVPFVPDGLPHRVPLAVSDGPVDLARQEQQGKGRRNDGRRWRRRTGAGMNKQD